MAFIYLHPAGSNNLTLTNETVRGTLNGAAMTFPGLKDGRLYPLRSVSGTNFRVNFRGLQRENYNTEHTEYRLLINGGLETMVKSMQQCPVYVIVYSTLLPCSVGGNQNLPPRCLEMIATARRNIRTACSNAQFYLYTNQNRPRTSPDQKRRQQYQRYFQTDMDYMRNENIIWLHP